MKLKNKPAIIGVIVCMLLMFLLIGIVALLTGGREMQDFTTTDWDIFIGFVVLEVIILVIMFILADRVGKANVKKPQEGPKTNRDKNFQLRGAGIFVVAFILAIAASCCSAVVAKALPAAMHANALWIFIALCAVAPILVLFNHVAGNLYFKRLNNLSVREHQEFFLSHRQDAIATAEKKLRLLRGLRILNIFYIVFLALLASGVCIFGYMVLEDGQTAAMLYGFFLFMCAVSRLRLPTPQQVYEDSDALVSPEEFPILYDVAQKAAQAVGCKGAIKIFLLEDQGAGIYSEGRYHCLYLSVDYIALLSRQELYAILLHEFRHATYEKHCYAREKHYHDWLAEGGNPHYLSHLAKHLFIFSDAFYVFNYMLYQFASTISIETLADRAMAEYADPKAAASALLKLKYISIYNWELDLHRSESLYVPEEADKQHLTHRIQRFKTALSHRQNFWNDLIGKEILGRAASHPTVCMRLEALGIDSYEILPEKQDALYAQEIQKAIDLLDQQLYEIWVEEYDENRRELYLKPLEAVEKWQAQGMPLVGEEYGDIVTALRKLSRNEEADALCRRAIAELDGPAAAYAQFVHGCYLLYNYDEAGLNHLYAAIEENNNYLDEGLELIGQFCCMTGNREALEEFRQKAVELAQQDKDLYSHIGTLNKNDKLSAENLPDGMLNDILGYIHSFEDGNISHIYLVRKTVTDDFFTSAFVIRFRNDATDEVRDEIMHKIFNYLDTCSSWQFSLFCYENVSTVKVECIEGSCVYEAQ